MIDELILKNISKEKLYANLVSKLIRERYSVDDEMAILRQKETKPEEWETYNTFCEECKAKAKEEIYGKEKER